MRGLFACAFSVLGISLGLAYIPVEEICLLHKKFVHGKFYEKENEQLVQKRYNVIA